MLTWIRKILAPPVFEGDEDKTRKASLLNTILLAVAVITAAHATFALFVYPNTVPIVSATGVVILLALGGLYLMRRGHVQLTSVLLSSTLWVMMTFMAVFSGGIRTPGFATYTAIILIAGLLLGERAGITFAGLSIVAGMGILYAEVSDLLPPPLMTTTSASMWGGMTGNFFVTAILLYLATRSINNALESARRSNRELQAMHVTLEQRVAERTRELEASQRVTFAASEHTSPDELLGLVVNLIRDQFNLYHAQVYIVDEEKKAAVLRESTGYAGRQLLQKKHQIPLDRPALITKAIREGEPVLVADVSQDENFLPNSLLPDTQSELVVPLKVGDKVIGALDVQDRTPGRFTERTVALFQTMTDQVAFLFENSELLERVTEQAEALTLFANQLRTAAEIARQLGTILDPERLLEQVVELLQNRFGLYHAHIYLLDERTRQLTVRAGSGEVGRVLWERGHSIPLDAEKSLVARAARTQETVVVDDTSVEPDFLPNPLLPDTRSEVSVPLVAGNRVLGVLDVQDSQPGRFRQSDLDVFSTLAGQIATALQNAGLFEQVEQSLEEAEIRFKVSQALAGAQTEEEVLDALIRQTDLYPKAQVSILLFDLNADEPIFVQRRTLAFDIGIPLVEEGTRFPMAQFPLVQCITPDAPFVSHNLLQDERVDRASGEIVRQLGLTSIAILPVMVGSEWLGVISAVSKEEGYFDERKLHLYQTLADQGAVALRVARLYDETRQTAERLREVDQFKSEFLANMSHGLRTPLNSIIGYTEIMLMGLDSELDPETLEDVQAIYDNGQHLLRIINDVLDLAKIEAGHMELSMEEVDIAPLLDEARTSNAGLLVNKPVEMTVEVEEDIPAIEADRVRLSQILNNLVSNAAKFTEEGDITLRAFRENGWVCIEVEDTGIGISEDHLEEVFERFRQVDGSSRRRAEGTGLGLAITRHLVQMHGGQLDVSSQVDQGSTFTVRLPIPSQETEASAGDGEVEE